MAMHFPEKTVVDLLHALEPLESEFDLLWDRIAQVPGLVEAAQRKEEQIRSRLAEDKNGPGDPDLTGAFSQIEESVLITSIWNSVRAARLTVLMAFKAADRCLRKTLKDPARWTELSKSYETLTIKNIHELEFDTVLGDFRSLIELLQSEAQRGAAGKRGGRKSGGANRALIEHIQSLAKDRYTDQEICRRLADAPRPAGARWRELSWPAALKKHPGAVRKWLSEARKAPL